jgi:prepilin-type N-terminal cleavage/methylation domain-containing protein
MARRGLTLVELLIVFSIVSLLMAVAFPALVRVRNQAQGSVCLQNTRTLGVAWLLYVDDHDNYLVGGCVGTGTGDWVAKPAGTDLESEKEGIRQGALFRYVSKIEAYRCPADQRKLGAGRTAFRSYSIAGGANGEQWKESYTCAKKCSELLRPSAKYIFVEEADPRGWNIGSWVLDPRNGTWVDPLAIWHSRERSSLGYGDGHAEMRLWLDSSTLEMSERQQFYCTVPAGEGKDLQFMLDGFPQKTREASGS